MSRDSNVSGGDKPLDTYFEVVIPVLEEAHANSISERIQLHFGYLLHVREVVK